MRRLIKWLLALAVLAVVAVVGVSLLRGADTPPAPKLPKAGATPSGELAGAPRPATGSFVGYRVDETLIGIGLNTAVGRTDEVRGSARIEGGRIVDARFEVDTGTLHGRARTVRVRLQSRRVGVGVDLVGSTPIEFADYGMKPPSVARVASVRDHGVLEVRLRLR